MKIFCERALQVVVILVLFLSCSEEMDQEQEQINENIEIEYSGEELFSAIFFLQGEAADNIESLQSNIEYFEKAIKSVPVERRENVTEFLASFQQDITKNISELNPDFFDNFKNDIESNDFYRIEATLNNGSKVLKEAGLSSKKFGRLFQLSELLNEKQGLSSMNLAQEDLELIDKQKEEYEELLKKDFNVNLDLLNGLPGTDKCLILVVIAVAAVAVVAAVESLIVGHAAVAVEVWAYKYHSTWSSDEKSARNAATNQIFIEDIAKTF